MREHGIEVMVIEKDYQGLQSLLNDLQISFTLTIDRRDFRREPLYRFNLKKAYGLRMKDLGFVPGNGSEIKALPKALLRPDYAIGLLAGLWLSDGSFSGRRPIFTTTSPVLEDQVRKLLRMIGFDSGSTHSDLPSGKVQRSVYLRGDNWKELRGLLPLWGRKAQDGEIVIS